MLGTNPDAYVVPSFPRYDYFAQVEGNLPPTPYVRSLIAKDASAFQHVFTIWEDPASSTGSAFSYAAQAQLDKYGFQIDWNSCNRFPASVGALPETFHACRLTKVSLSELPPITLVVRPANGAQLAGRQYLAASASAPVGLRKVEFSIIGQGRAIESGAIFALYGWLGVWNTRSVPNGRYTVQSVAYATNGLVKVSPGVVVEVKN